MKKQVIRLTRHSRIPVPVNYLLAMFVATVVALMPHTATARGITYRYVDTLEARVYSADVSQSADFIEQVKTDKSMWRKSGAITAMSLKPVSEDAQASGGMLMVGATSLWTTDGYFANTGTTTVIQKVGHRTFLSPGFDPIVLEPTVTLQPASWTIVKRIDKDFDPDWHQYGPSSAAGLYGLAVDSHVQASVFLSFSDGLAKFECPALTKFLVQSAGSSLTFNMIRTDLSPHVGSYPTVLNTTSSGVQFDLLVCVAVDDCVSELHVATPGISQFGIARLCETGCSVKMCLVSCTAGLAGSLPSGVYPFISIGDGGTQVARLPQ